MTGVNRDARAGVITTIVIIFFGPPVVAAMVSGIGNIGKQRGVIKERLCTLETVLRNELPRLRKDIGELMPEAETLDIRITNAETGLRVLENTVILIDRTLQSRLEIISPSDKAYPSRFAEYKILSNFFKNVKFFLDK